MKVYLSLQVVFRLRTWRDRTYIAPWNNTDIFGENQVMFNVVNERLTNWNHQACLTEFGVRSGICLCFAHISSGWKLTDNEKLYSARKFRQVKNSP